MILAEWKDGAVKAPPKGHPNVRLAAYLKEDFLVQNLVYLRWSEVYIRPYNKRGRGLKRVPFRWIVESPSGHPIKDAEIPKYMWCTPAILPTAEEQGNVAYIFKKAWELPSDLVNYATYLSGDSFVALVPVGHSLYFPVDDSVRQLELWNRAKVYVLETDKRQVYVHY